MELAGLDSPGVDQERLHGADVAWRFLTSTCKGMAFKIMEQAQSPSEAWTQLRSYYQAGDFSEHRRVQRELGTTAMEPAGDPKKSTLRVDRNVSEQNKIGTEVK